MPNARDQLMLTAALCAALLWPSSASAAQCRVDGAPVRLPVIPEASGIASSRAVADRLWALNDSGQPTLFALDTSGTLAGQVRLAGAAVEDWEAVAVAPCAGGSCIYVGDIGDNNAARKDITIYRLPEPASASATARAETFKATYPDGPHDAEALLAMPDGRLYIVTKGSGGPIAIYRFPSELQSGAVMKLERVGKPKDTAKAGARDEWITDASASRDGARIVLRTHHALYLYSAAQLLAGNWQEEQRIDIGRAEPQGEGVTFGNDDALYLVSEGGARAQPGVFTRLSCTTGG
jgi:hypothetical protein